MIHSYIAYLSKSISLFSVCLTCFIAMSTAKVFAVETLILRDESFSEFNQGVSTGTELLAVGRLQVGPRAIIKEKSEEGVVWDIATDLVDGSIFYSTGHNGKVFHLQSNGKLEVWADLPEVQATSIAIDPKGGILVGASPSGKIYRITQKNKPELFFETNEKYVWDMIFDRDGVLYAATGPQGKIFRIRGERNGEVYYDSDATNVMALDFDGSGKLLAATQGKGYVLQISSSSQAYILYAASQDEIRSLAVDSEGNIYAAANSARIASVFDKSSTSTAGFGTGLDGAGQIIQIQPSGFVTGYWSAPEGPIHDLLADFSTTSVIVAAGKSGKLYRVHTADSAYSVIADVDEPMVTALANGKETILVGTANKAVIYELETSAPLVSGIFASRPLNAKSTVQWGNLMFDGEVYNGNTIQIETRSGNTPEPSDGTWSAWVKAENVASQITKIQSPVAQYLQYRITMTAVPDQTVQSFVDSVQVFYVQKNAPPVIRKIDLAKVPGSPAAAQAAALAAAAARIQQGAASSDDSKARQAGEEATRAAQAAARAAQSAVTASAAEAGNELQNSQKLNISWTAEDPNDDKLRYDLFYKGEDETVWKLIEDNLTASRHQFSTEAIPDGQYRFKVVATDRFDNQDTSASVVELSSRIYTVDNSSPEITEFVGTAAGNNEYEITATATDKTSIISAAEYNLNAADEWRTLAPVDGIFDFHTEQFKVRVKPDKVQPEHTLSIRAYDREGNSRVEKILLH